MRPACWLRAAPLPTPGNRQRLGLEHRGCATRGEQAAAARGPETGPTPGRARGCRAQGARSSRSPRRRATGRRAEEPRQGQDEARTPGRVDAAAAGADAPSADARHATPVTMQSAACRLRRACCRSTAAATCASRCSVLWMICLLGRPSRHSSHKATGSVGVGPLIEIHGEGPQPRPGAQMTVRGS